MKIGICGTGSWGTALAQVLADNEHQVIMWGMSLDQVVDIHLYHQNEQYFPGLVIHSEIDATQDIQALSDADLIILAVPSIAIEDVCLKLQDVLTKKTIIINVSKGFHPTTFKRLSEVVVDSFKPELLSSVVSLIGPSHAEEVILRKLTSVNAVSDNLEDAQIVQQAFSNQYFRVYTSNDVVGAEIGSAVKNIIALGSGMLEGLEQGDNARAALITRGLAEMTRFGVAFGANPMSFLGLNGVGDLVVTCASRHSRNFQAGLLIGECNDAKPFWDNNEATVEGVYATKIVHEMSLEHNISMPITSAIYEVLYNNKKPSEMIASLMSRELKSENITF